jgi:hypothetical protein
MGRTTHLATLIICLCGLAMTVQAQKAYRISDDTVGDRIHRLASSARDYNNALHKGLKKSIYASARDEKILRQAGEFEVSTYRLKERFDHDRNHDERSLSDDVRLVLRRATNVNSYMVRNFGRTGADDRWAEVKQNLELVARSYNVGWVGYGISNRPWRMDDQDARELLDRIKDDAELFRKGMESYLKVDRSIDRYTRDDINNEIKYFISVSSRLRRRVDDKDAGAAEFNELMNSMVKINSFLNSKGYRLPRQIKDDWRSITNNLRKLAAGYRVSTRAYNYNY